MKRFIASLVVFGMVLLAGAAFAAPILFDVDGPSDSYVQLSNIERLGWTSITATLNNGLETYPDFILNDGQSRELNFFTLAARGVGFGTFDLTANLNFDTPDLNAGGIGSGCWATFFGLLSGGVFHWEDAVQTFNLDGNLIQIALDDGFTLVCGNDVTVGATVTNLGTAPVPEPATLMLLGSGLLGLAGFRRMRK